jgi:hypothetical protein
MVQVKKYFYIIIRNHTLITLFKKIIGIQKMLKIEL